jgi:hypothetical protein
MAEFRKLFYALGLAALLAGVSTTAKAQGISCSVGAGSVPTVVRSESFADLVGDYVLDCVGGVPTTPGAVVPSVNVSLTLSTNITSKILDNSPGVISAGGAFTEALLIVDEPNVAPNAARPLLACGDTGAAYNPNGIGVCQITAPTDPNLTYDGSTNVYGTLTCDGVDPDGTGPLPARPTATQYGCGRPNVFQPTDRNRSSQTETRGPRPRVSWLTPYSASGESPRTSRNHLTNGRGERKRAAIEAQRLTVADLSPSCAALPRPVATSILLVGCLIPRRRPRD